MTETAGEKPFPGFPGFPPAEMLDKMWDMMRLTPFGAAFPGMNPGTAQGMGSPLAAMSDMMTPLMNVEELDKRITDMRAVEQWLKLNLNMLQSAIQALEVQRATLSTLRAFGAFAQASMSQPTQGEAASRSSSSSAESASRSSWSTGAAAADADKAQAGGTAGAGEAQQAAPFDPSAWWNLLQSQFNQLASFAMTQPGTAESASAAAGKPGARDTGSRESDAAGAGAGAGAAGPKAAAAKPAAKRTAPRKSAGKPRGPAASSSQSK